MKIRKAEYDFMEQGLPSNRVEVFFDSLKLRYGLIMKTGLLLFAFMMPLLAAFFTKDAYIVSIQSLLTKGEITESSYEAMYSMVCRIAYLACIPCFMIFSLGLAGALRVFRQLIWGEGIFFIQDFFDGLKKNALHYILYAFLFGVAHYLSRMALLLNISSGLLKVLPIVITLFILLPIILFALMESQFYKLKIHQEVKNGFLLYIRTFFKSFIALAIILIPVMFVYINLYYFKMIAIILFMILILPLVLLGEIIFFTGQFDRFINKDNYPEIYRKGLVERKLEDK